MFGCLRRIGCFVLVCVLAVAAYLTREGLASIAPDNFGEMHLMNNDLETPYSDQFTLGMRNRVWGWNTSVAVAYTKSYKGLVASSGNRFGDGTWYWYDTFDYAPFQAPVPNAGGGRFWHPSEERTLTLREAARLQGFPDSFRFQAPFSYAAVLVGNALDAAISKTIYKVIKDQLS